MKSTLRTVTVALAATMLIAACGSDDSGSDAGTQPDTAIETTDVSTTDAPTDSSMPATTESTESTDSTDEMTEDTTATTEVPEQDVEADAQAAAAALLTLGDFPEGWTEAPAEGDAASEISARLAECAGLEGLTPTGAQATTGDFANADGALVVEETVGITATERDARLVNASVSPPDVAECLAAAYSELGAAALSPGAVPDGAEIGVVTATRFAVGSVGDATQAIRLSIPVTAAGTASTVTVDHVLIRSGRSVALVSFENRVEPTAVETIDEINAAAAALLAA